MKKQWKGFISGIMVSLVLLGLIGTAAATVSRKTVNVDYNDITITLDGKEVALVDANGDAVEPFIINGTTYLPVRAVSNALGLNVGWDQATTTVILETPSYTAPKDAAANGTVEQANALKSANGYLSFTALSYEGLIKQLKFDGYSAEAATYAADHCGADWNAQAAEAARRYLALFSFSRQQLIDQLEFDGFTHAQAVYGAEANGY